MSLKLVEMQIAIPRTQEASNIQTQLNKNGQQFQNLVTENGKEIERNKRQSIQAAEKTMQFNNRPANEQSKALTEKSKNNHPYLGVNYDQKR